MIVYIWVVVTNAVIRKMLYSFYISAIENMSMIS